MIKLISSVRSSVKLDDELVPLLDRLVSELQGTWEEGEELEYQVAFVIANEFAIEVLTDANSANKLSTEGKLYVQYEGEYRWEERGRVVKIFDNLDDAFNHIKNIVAGDYATKL